MKKAFHEEILLLALLCLQSWPLLTEEEEKYRATGRIEGGTDVGTQGR
jgi:hypothetical protein